MSTVVHVACEPRQQVLLMGSKSFFIRNLSGRTVDEGSRARWTVECISLKGISFQKRSYVLKEAAEKKLHAKTKAVNAAQEAPRALLVSVGLTIFCTRKSDRTHALTGVHHSTPGSL